MKAITVNIPHEGDFPYTLYAQGFSLTIPQSVNDKETYKLCFDETAVLVLFYTFKKFRRAYIVANWTDKSIGSRKKLPGVDKDLLLLYEARGHKIDYLKRSLYLLETKCNAGKDIYKLPLLFWYRLAGVIQYQKAVRREVMGLYEEFKGKKQ